MPKQIVISIHDAAPNFTQKLKTVFNVLDELGVKKRTILIVPDFAKENLLSENKNFIEFMLDEERNGAELGLHGIYHHNFEFKSYDYEGAKAALEFGRKVFFDAFGKYPKGFVAPQWLQSKGSLRAIHELGFLYTATLRTLRYSDGKEFKTLPLNFDWGNSFLDKVIAELNNLAVKFRRKGLIRFAVHPMDVPNGVFEREMAILSNLLKKGWQPTTYEEFHSHRELKFKDTTTN